MRSFKLLKHKLEKFHLSRFWILSGCEKEVLLKIFLLEMRRFNLSHCHLMLFTERKREVWKWDESIETLGAGVVETVVLGSYSVLAENTSAYHE
jgi:hypothetical protein